MSEVTVTLVYEPSARMWMLDDGTTRSPLALGNSAPPRKAKDAANAAMVGRGYWPARPDWKFGGAYSYSRTFAPREATR